MLFFVKGDATVGLGDDVQKAQAGTWVHMPTSLKHSIKAKTPVVMLLVLMKCFPDGNKRFTGLHDDRLIQVHPAAFAHDCRRQQTQALTRHGVDPEYGHPPSGLNAFKVEPGNDSVVGESKGEVRVVVEWDHPAFFL